MAVWVHGVAMSKAVGKLTKRQIERWVMTGERFQARSDGANLWIRYREEDLYPRWFFRYTLRGKQRFISLGSYRDVSLSMARSEASKLRGRLAAGVDVASERGLQAASRGSVSTQIKARTVGWLADEYFTRYVDGRVKHPNIVRALIENRIKPVLGEVPLEKVMPSHVDELIRSTALSAPTVSTKLLSRLKLIFNLGVKLGYLGSNPASVFDARDAGGVSAPRQRWLTEAELRSLMTAMRIAHGWNLQNTLTVKLLLMLAVRKSELIQARLDEFDLEAGIWHLPAERTKSGSAIDIPLPHQAKELIGQLKELSMGSGWLLPARKMQTRMTPYISADTVNAALAKAIRPKMVGIEPFVLHDLRRTARTHLEAMGVAPHVAERCLNHKVRGLVGVYNRHDYFNERRTALQAWADAIDSFDKSDAGP